jgi:hypothetical protein
VGPDAVFHADDGAERVHVVVLDAAAPAASSSAGVSDVR